MATPKKSGKKGGKSANGVQKKSGLVFPTGRVTSMIKKGRYARRVSRGAGVFTAATLEFLVSESRVLEFLVSESLELASKVAKGRRITPRALCLAIRNDADLGALLQNVTISRGGVAAAAAQKGEKKKKSKKSKKSKKTAKK